MRRAKVEEAEERPGEPRRERPGSFAGRNRSVQWAALVVASAAFVVVLELVGLPAAVLLGTMAAAALLAVSDATIRLPERFFQVAQATVGCLIAQSFTPGFLAALARDWMVFLAGVFSVIGASGVVAYLLARWRVLPGTTAIWGSSPGAATAMTVIAEAYGADIRLVAFMQYLRVVCVAAVASIVAAIWGTTEGTPVAAHEWFPALSPGPFAVTVGLIALGAFVAPRFRVPAGSLLLVLVLGVILQVTGTAELELPPWLLASSYVFIGWTIGLRFTREILASAARALPRVLVAILLLIGSCGALGLGLAAWLGIDPMTAYLATTPGGADSVAIIAASSDVDLPFVMAMQTARFLGVLLLGPGLARFIARLVPPRPRVSGNR